MKFKSIISRIVFTVLPVVFLATISLVLISYFTSSRQLERLTKDRMNALLDMEASKIAGELASNKAVAQNTISYVAAADSSDFLSGKYIKFLQENIPTNPNTIGGGIWFEPYALSEDTEYFGPYVYMEGGEPVWTDIYSNADYDYPNTDWYINGENSQDGSMVYSDVYYDPVSGINMLTGTQPFYDENGAFLGTVTADMDTVDIERMISEIRIGDTGRAFLIGANGQYISFADLDRNTDMLISSDVVSDMVAFGGELFAQEAGETTLQLNGVDETVFFNTLPGVGWKLGIMINSSELVAPITRLTTTMLVVTVATLAIMTLVVLSIAKYLKGNINMVNSFSKNAAAGVLTERLALETGDEFQEIGANLNIMMENMGQLSQSCSTMVENSDRLIERIRKSAENVSNGSKSIVDVSVMLSSDSSEQASTIESLSGSADNILQLTTRNASRAEETASLANDILTAASQGDEQMLEMVKAVQGIVDASENISSVIKDINDIAFQTNILALNASVEAARAGQHGKGFSVVADEVRNLAIKSAEAAKKTSALIEESVERANLGSRIADSTSQSLKDIVSSIGKSAEIISGMSSSSQEQAHAVEQITQQIQQVEGIAQKNASSAEQTSASAQEMNALAVELNDIVLRYGGKETA